MSLMIAPFLNRKRRLMQQIPRLENGYVIVSKGHHYSDSYSIQLTSCQLPIISIKLLKKIAVRSPPEPSLPSQYWMKSLAFPEMDNRSKDIDDAAEGTCEWLLRHDAYRSWVTCDQDLLWIKGKPGS